MANGQLNLGKQSGGVLSVSFPDGVNNTEVVLPESGNVVSIDGSVTDNAVARYDGVNGKLQDSGVIIDDNNQILSNTPIKFTTTTPNSVNLLIGSNIVDRALEFSEYTVSTLNSVGHRLNAPFTGGQIVFATESVDKVLITASGNLLLTSGTGALGYGTGAGGTVTQLTSKSTAVTLNKPTGQITMNNAALAAGAAVSFTVNNSLVTVSDQVVPKVAQASLLYSIVASSVGNGSFVLYLKNETAASRSEVINVTFSIIKGAVA